MIDYAMTKHQERVLRKIFSRLVRQSFDHKNNICKIFSMLRNATDEEFVEDPAPSLDGFMLECFETSQSQYYIRKSQ